jgi:hypothetical protein
MNNNYVIRANFAVSTTTTAPPQTTTTTSSTIEMGGMESDVPLTVNEEGIVQNDVQLTNEDNDVALDIPSGTKMLDAHGNALKTITLEELTTVPVPPPTGAVVLAYDFGPDGATFDPAILLTLKYDPADLPAGSDESALSITWWDGNKWVELESTVNTTTHTITAYVSHFTNFAVMATLPPEPAIFALSNLSIIPAEANINETVTISVRVTNIGEAYGTHTVILNINGKKEAEKQIMLVGGQSQTVNFKVSRDVVGSYTVTIEGLTGIFTVVDLTAPIETATVTKTLTLTETETAAPVTTTLPPKTVTTTQPPETATVTHPIGDADKPNWFLIGGLIACLAVIIGLITYILTRKGY